MIWDEFVQLSPFIIGFFVNAPIETVVRNISDEDIKVNLFGHYFCTINYRLITAFVLCLVLSMALNIKNIHDHGVNSWLDVLWLLGVIFGESQFSFMTIWKNHPWRAVMQPPVTVSNP